MNHPAEIAALKARITELESVEARVKELEGIEAARRALPKTTTQPLPIDSRGLGPSYDHMQPEAMRAKAEAERVVPDMSARRVRFNYEKNCFEEVASYDEPSPRDEADRATAIEHHMARGLPVGAPDED